MQQPHHQDPNHLLESPLWYFAFGSSVKSSLLNEYSRQHNIKYIPNSTSQNLKQWVNHQCIIQATISTLLEWQTKKQNISVIFVGENFTEQELRIMQDYQQIGRCKYIKDLTNYEQFRKTMYPNLIFFYGPSKPDRQGAASTIAFQSCYKYIAEFPQNSNYIISKMKKNFHYTFNWVFTDPKQIQILLSRFNIRIVHFRFLRTDFPNDQAYFDTQYNLLNYLNGKSFFLSLDAHQSKQNMMDQIGEFLCPQLTFINANNEQQKSYAKKYSHDKGIRYYSIFDIQAVNKRKNIPLALTLQDKVRRMTSIIFNDLNSNQVVLLDFPWHVNEFRIFQHVNRKLSRFVDLDPSREYMYNSQYSSNIYFLQTQRRIQPNLKFPLASQMEKHQRYWLVSGPQGVGKTTIAKYLESQYQLINIEYEPYVANLKEKLLAPEDGEELPLKKIIAHFKELIGSNQQQEYVIDGLNYSQNDLQQWIRVIGPPTVLNLKSEQNEIIKRQRKKAQSDLAAEISQEQSQKVKQSIQKQGQWIQKLNEICQDAVIYTLDYNTSLILAEKLLQSVFQPRVFLVQSNPTLLYHNIAIRYNCCLINLAINNFNQAKKIAKSSGKRDVIIINYRQTQDKLVSEDLYWIEKNIGKIRYLSIWGGEQKFYQEQKIHLERPVQEKKPKQQVEGEQGQEPPVQQPVEQEGEVKKKKLDIYAYEWTKPVCYKNLSQWYFKLKNNVKEYNETVKQSYERFQQKLREINNNPNVSVYSVLTGNR